jgi:hypothetical protein
VVVLCRRLRTPPTVEHNDIRRATAVAFPGAMQSFFSEAPIHHVTCLFVANYYHVLEVSLILSGILLLMLSDLQVF